MKYERKKVKRYCVCIDKRTELCDTSTNAIKYFDTSTSSFFVFVIMNYCCVICDTPFRTYNTSLFFSNYFFSVDDKKEKGCLYCTKHGLKVAGQCTQMIDELLSVVFKHVGKVVGSYVREYLIAKMEFKDTTSKIIQLSGFTDATRKRIML